MVSVPNQTTNLTATTFLESNLSKFGALAKIVTDQGCEFTGENSNLLNQYGIDHWLASREHPQTDGLAKRMVQTLKQGLKESLTERTISDWNMVFPYVSMGYKSTMQKALDYSSYFVFFGRRPIF